MATAEAKNSEVQAVLKAVVNILEDSQKGFADIQRVVPLFSDHAQDSDGFPGDFGSDTVTGEDQNVQIQRCS